MFKHIPNKTSSFNLKIQFKKQVGGCHHGNYPVSNIQCNEIRSLKLG